MYILYIMHMYEAIQVKLFIFINYNFTSFSLLSFFLSIFFPRFVMICLQIFGGISHIRSRLGESPTGLEVPARPRNRKNTPPTNGQTF